MITKQKSIAFQYIIDNQLEEATEKIISLN
jgi:hypothetical protein